MKRKKKGLSPLKRVLLCSWCVLGLLSAIFLIKWAVNLSPENSEGNVGSFAQSGNGKDAMQQGGEPTKSLHPASTPTSAPTPTPTSVPRAEFTKEYPHMGTVTESYAYTEGVAYGFRYPCYDHEAETSADAVLANAVADAAHQLMAEKVTELAKAEGKEKFLLIDYEDGETAGLYSVLFYIEKEVDGVKTTETSGWIYNKKKGESVDAETLFENQAYRYVAQQVNALPAEEQGEEGTDVVPEEVERYEFTGTREEFPAYVLTADGVKFYYDGDRPDGFIVIPYIAVHTYMAVTENGTVRADNIRELDPDKPMIALTFDDGPHYQQTPRLLEMLEQYNAKSTFFILGDRSHFTESNKKTVTMVAEAGHEVASHTYAHKDLKTLSKEGVIAEVVKARDNLYALTGEYPTYIRPPYGGYNDLVKEYAYAPLINWDLDSKDWSFRDVDKIVEHVLKEARDGRIVLMHDIHWFTVDAVERLLPELAAQGYQFVTVSELFYYNNVEKINGKVYYGGYN